MAVPWGFVNKLQSDHFMLMPSEGGANLYLGNQRTTDGMTPEMNRCVTYDERYDDPGEVWLREEYAAAMLGQGLPARKESHGDLQLLDPPRH